MYAVGPSPAKPGQVIGSAGPTTTARMGRYLPALFAAGVRAIIGKGELHGADMAACVEHGAVYLAAIGGLGALLAKRITAARVVSYPELGPEALFELELAAFPAVVIIDRLGQNLHEHGPYAVAHRTLNLEQWRASQIPNPGSRIPNPESRIPSPERVTDPKFRHRGCESGGLIRLKISRLRAISRTVGPV